MTTTKTQASSWVKQSDVFKAPLTIPELTVKTKVDVNTTSSVVKTMMESGINAIYIENDNGTAMAVVIGNEPTKTITLSLSLTEVQ